MQCNSIQFNSIQSKAETKSFVPVQFAAAKNCRIALLNFNDKKQLEKATHHGQITYITYAEHKPMPILRAGIIILAIDPRGQNNDERRENYTEQREKND